MNSSMKENEESKKKKTVLQEKQDEMKQFIQRKLLWE